MIHENISPFKACIETSFLYDLDTQYVGQYTPCTVFGVSSYPSDALTFMTLLHDGSIFAYIPFHALTKKPQKPNSELELSDLVYQNCPSADIATIAFEHLKGETTCFFPRKKLWLQGTYLFTIDWYKDNSSLNVVELANGQYAALPNHKMKIRNRSQTFPPYRKMHQTWKVDETPKK